MISVDNLSVTFGRTEAVRGISFAVPEGSSFGIVGESGSGKFTVLRALSGLNPDWTGRMSIAGTPLTILAGAFGWIAAALLTARAAAALHTRVT